MGNSLKVVMEWIDLFIKKENRLYNMLSDIYGEDLELIEERIFAYLSVLKLFADTYGPDRKVVIARAPGRINIMGKHIDHRGGYVNVMAVNKEVIIVASARCDDCIKAVDFNPVFGKRAFDIKDYFGKGYPSDWMDYIESEEVAEAVSKQKGDWINYIKGAVLRLQYEYKDEQLKGMDMALYGNIPVSAGLSGSSAVVVCTAEAFMALNKRSIKPERFVELCGEGEWYVGVRNGISDPASIKLAKKGMVVKLGFLPFHFEKTYCFPEGYKLIIANSYVKADKSGSAKDGYNGRVATYEFGLMLLKKMHPQYADMIGQIRDINTDTLGINLIGIYNLILSLPEKISPDELFKLLPKEDHSKINRLLSTHNPYRYYYIRAVVMYGIAECHRAKLCEGLLEAGSINEFGDFMNISHNGDRVVRYDSNGNSYDYNWSVSEQKLKRLIDDLRSNDNNRVSNAWIEKQPGGYACSVPEIDYLIDSSLQVKGVIGAQISGAGLGGCAMFLAENDSVNELLSKITDKYYRIKGLKPDISVCVPVSGSCVISL